MAFFANLFGYVLKFLYDIVGNYGIAIILFSILVKVIMIPLTIKQQKSLKKNQKMQEEMKQIQFKYKNDPEKLNQEVMALYKREGMNFGCTSSIIQIILLISVFLLVRQPLTYMVKMDKDVLSKIETQLIKQEDSRNNAYKEIAIIQNIQKLENQTSVDKNQEKSKENENEEDKKSDENKSEETEKIDISKYKDQISINMNFFGIDLSQVPTQNLSDWKVLIIPALYIISSFISIKLSTSINNNKKDNEKKLITDGNGEEKEENYNPMQDMNKTMVWMMPIMSVSIAAIAPLGLALYWLMNNILMIVERLVFNKIFNKEEEAEKNA